MKIENNGINPLSTQPTDNARPVERNTRAGENVNVAASKDKATLSERAKSLAKARTALEDVSDVRQNRVDELKEKIDSGKYEINYDALANKLLKQFGLK
jgi:negative regulator of flagellin synthesis FlgM